MKLDKAHIYFWIVALICFVISITFFDSDAALDINVHDTYFIIAYFHLISLLSTVLAFIGLIYYFHFKFDVNLNKILTKAHLVGSIVVLIVLMLGSLYFEIKPSNPNFPLFDDFSNEILLYSLSFLAFGALQIFFVLSSIFSTIRYFIKK